MKRDIELALWHSMLSVVMLSGVCAECRKQAQHAECRRAKWRGAHTNWREGSVQLTSSQG